MPGMGLGLFLAGALELSFAWFFSSVVGFVVSVYTKTKVSVTYGSVVKSACCSSRETEFNSQHPHPAAPKLPILDLQLIHNKCPFSVVFLLTTSSHIRCSAQDR